MIPKCYLLIIHFKLANTFQVPSRDSLQAGIWVLIIDLENLDLQKQQRAFIEIIIFNWSPADILCQAILFIENRTK